MLAVALAALPLIAASASGPSQAPAPTFGTGDLAQLRCQVVEVRAESDFWHLLTIELSNDETIDAEPLEFEIELQEKKGEPARRELFRRTTLPRVHRFGRPAPAGGSEQYVVATALIGKRAQYRVRVARASWVEGGSVPRPELLVGKPEEVQLTSLTGSYPVTQLRLHNPLEQDLDALFLIRFTRPAKLTELRGVRLAAGQSLDWALSSLAGTRTFLAPGSPPGCAMVAVEVELADWSLASPFDPAAGRALLHDAYAAWLRWEDPRPTVSGKFRYRERRAKVNANGEYEDFEVGGRFTIGASGPAEMVIESGGGANPSHLLAEAFADLRRESWETVLEDNEVLLVDDDRVELRGPGFGSLRTNSSTLATGSSANAAGVGTDLQIRGGRIAGSGVGDGERTAWETQAWDHGYVVTRRRGPTTESSFSYRREGTLTVPERVTETTVYGAVLFSAQELLLDELRVEGTAPIARPPVQGEGAEALRALWDAAYRLPTEPIRLRAGFEVLQPGTDGTWCGVKRIAGKLEMVGVGPHLRSLRCDFEGRLAAEVEMALASAVRDRLLMWHARDFNARPSFEEFFGGCSITKPTADGSFVIAGGPIARVLTADGLVRGWETHDGSTRRFDYQEFDGRHAVTKVVIESRGPGGKRSGGWTETVTIGLGKVGEHLLPVSLRFEEVFGEDWGPETLKFKGLELE